MLSVLFLKLQTHNLDGCTAVVAETDSNIPSRRNQSDDFEEPNQVSTAKSTLQDTQSTSLETDKETQHVSSNVALSAQTIDLPHQSLEKEDKNEWIFYDGIPKTGTSSLRQSVIDTGSFQIKDITSWGCKSSVANNWREACEEDLLSKNA